MCKTLASIFGLFELEDRSNSLISEISAKYLTFCVKRKTKEIVQNNADYFIICTFFSEY